MIVIQKLKILLVTITAPLFKNRGTAVEVLSISTAMVAVSDQSSQMLQKILPQALEQALVRISSGNTEIMILLAIRDTLSKINNYVEKCSYIVKADKAEKKDEQQFLLQVVFDKLTRHFLQNVKRAVWSTSCPLTMAWILVLNGSQPEILASERPKSSNLHNIAGGILVRYSCYFSVGESKRPDQCSVIRPYFTFHSSTSGNFAVLWYRFYSIRGSCHGCQLTTASRRMAVIFQWYLLRMADNEARCCSSSNEQNPSCGDKMANQFSTFISDINTDMFLFKIKIVGNLEGLVKALQLFSHLVAEGISSQRGLKAVSLFYRWKINQPPTESWTAITFSFLH